MGTEYQSQETAYSKCDSDPSRIAIYYGIIKIIVFVQVKPVGNFIQRLKRVDRLASIKS